MPSLQQAATSASVEDYIKAIYKEQSEAGVVSTHGIATRLDVSPPAVTKMLRRLSELRLVVHSPYHGVTLTPAGEKMALEVIRHHRLIERYLVQALGYGWDEVHDEAEKLEHHISEEFEERIDMMMGHPDTCPHGDPIPTREGQVSAVSASTLADQAWPEALTVSRVGDEDAEMLRYIRSLGLGPGREIELVDREPFGGAFLVRVHDDVVRVAPLAARQVFVERRRERV